MKQNFFYLDQIDTPINNTSTIEVLKVGKLFDRDLEITEKMLTDYVANFEKNVYGTEIQVNLSHDRDGEAAGWVKSLYVENGKLLAEVEWTPLGIQKIKDKQFKYTSSEIAQEFPHYETGEKVSNVFIGVALTNVPAVKGMQAVTCSEKINLKSNNLKMNKSIKSLYDVLLKQETLSAQDVSDFQDFAKVENYELSEEEMKPLEEKVETEEEELTEEEKEKLAAKKKKEAALKAKEKATDKYEEDAESEEEEEEKAVVKEELSEAKTVELAEMIKLKEEYNKMKQELNEIKLSEMINNSFLLNESKGVGVGFLESDVAELKNFFASLTGNQIEQFKSLMTKVRNVDFKVYGSASNATPKVETKEEKLAALENQARQLAEESGKDQAMILSELYFEAGITE